MNNKQNIAPSLGGTYYADQFNITTNVDKLLGEVKCGNGFEWLEGNYIGTDAINLADYQNLPALSKIWDKQAFKVYFKIGDRGDNTWKTFTGA